MHDLVIRNGTVHDGEGGMPYAADVAIDGDRISAVMPAIGDRGRREIDAAGLAVGPGFINMLSWAIPSLIADGRAQSDVRQGVTLEVFGEGSSMGPLTDEMRRDQIERQTDIKYDVPWTTLREGLEHLVRRGVSVNVASFVGATTLRVHDVGYDDRPECINASVGARGRVQGVVRSPPRSGGARTGRPRDACPRQGVGEPLPRRGRRGGRAPRVLQDRAAEAAHREDAR